MMGSAPSGSAAGSRSAESGLGEASPEGENREGVGDIVTCSKRRVCPEEGGEGVPNGAG